MIRFNPCSKIFVEKKAYIALRTFTIRRKAAITFLAMFSWTTYFYQSRLFYYADYDGVILEIFKNNAVFIKHS